MEQNNSELEKYLFDLPDKRIAKFPLENRDESKLLVYKNGGIHHDTFKQVIHHIPESATIFLNNTKVIAARLFFQKETGARIEVFLTEPLLPHSEFQQALKAKKTCTWKCMIGNLKKWKEGTAIFLKMNDIRLSATLVDKEECQVQFSWDTEHEFLAIVEAAGHVPLPPYLNREEEEQDKERYQTVFSEKEGAVAAPTAGLHFTKETLNAIAADGHVVDRLTLHVSAGTFRPIKSKDFRDHDMHNERVIINRENLTHILECKGPVLAVGTTAMRTLESLYWYGALLTLDSQAEFQIKKDTAYREELKQVGVQQSIQSILGKMDQLETSTLRGETEIYIYPGYEFQIVDGLFTNFHMPSSTLILLVAAFVGEDWQRIYDEALENDYRFLSYGDTSLLLK